jgi:hypothetical protein
VGALAHGPAPAPLEVLTLHADGRPDAVRTSIGLSTGWRGHARYVCAGAWEGEVEAPPMAALPDGRLVVGARSGVWLGDASGCVFEPVGGFDADRIDALVAGAEGVWVLARDGGDSALLRVNSDGGLTEQARFADRRLDGGALDSNGRLWVAGASPEPAAGPVDGPLDPLTGLLAQAQFVQVRSAGDRLFLTASVGAERVLAERTEGIWTPRIRVDGAVGIHGPVVLDGETVAVAAGELWVQGGDGAFTVAPDGLVGWTCLQQVGERVLACADRGLVDVSGPAHAPDIAPAWSLSSILGVDPACPTRPEVRELCEQDWLHFAGEAGLYRFDAGAPPPDPGPDTGPDPGRETGPDAGVRPLDTVPEREAPPSGSPEHGEGPGGGATVGEESAGEASGGCIARPGAPGGWPWAALLLGWAVRPRRRHLR